MNFSLLLTVTVVLIAASNTPSKASLEIQRTLLEEIMDSINHLKNNNLTHEVHVEKVITTSTCEAENFCKAGEVLKEIHSDKLKLKEDKWLLPRRLIAYTRDITCENHKNGREVSVADLLQSISSCAQMVYSHQK